MLLALILLCTITVYLVYARSQELVAVSTLAIVLATIPVFAVAFAHLLLGEALSSTIAGSALVILAGIVTIATDRSDARIVDLAGIEDEVFSTADHDTARP